MSHFYVDIRLVMILSGIRFIGTFKYLLYLVIMGGTCHAVKEADSTMGPLTARWT